MFELKQDIKYICDYHEFSKCSGEYRLWFYIKAGTWEISIERLNSDLLNIYVYKHARFAGQSNVFSDFINYLYE
jgi:hypothetical protein